MVEYWDDEMIVHLSDTEFILGRHPIINRTREYFAFQFDLPGAAIDNVPDLEIGPVNVMIGMRRVKK